MEQILLQNGFTHTEIEDLISHALVIKCPKRTVLLREGEVQRFFYWATKGIYRAGFTDKKGIDHTHNFYTPKSIPFVVSYSSFMSQRPSFSFIESIEDGELMSWHYDYVQKLIDTDIKWLKFFKNQLDKILLFIELKELASYTFTPEEKYLSFLIHAHEFAHSIPQHYIASYIGVSPEALSRIRGRIQSKTHSTKSLK
jgi:CRP-like cAMP-binding protein